MAIDRNLTPLEINTDSIELVNMFCCGHLLYETLISECKYLMQRLGAPRLVYVFREQNRIADALAKEGAKMEGFDDPTFLEVPLMCDRGPLHADIVGTTFIRKTKIGNILSHQPLI